MTRFRLKSIAIRAIGPAWGAMTDDAARLRTSGDVHPAEEPAGAVAGFAFYNVGRQNAEVYANNWKNRLKALSEDLSRIFCEADNTIHVLCISEFGNMEKNIDQVVKSGAECGILHAMKTKSGTVECFRCEDTKSLFEMILRRLGLTTIEVVAHPPYVTLVDREWWTIKEAKTEYNMCSHKKHFLQHLLLSSRASGARQPAVVRIFNNHMPSSMGSAERKYECLRNCIARCSEQDAWIIGGDLNMAAAYAMAELRDVLAPTHKQCISRSGHRQTDDAQKADWACSSGIELVHVTSWVGIHSEPCLSDVHDMVAVIGEIHVKCSGASQPAVAERTSATGSASMEETATKPYVQESSDACVDIGAVQPSVAAMRDKSLVQVSGAAQPARCVTVDVDTSPSQTDVVAMSGGAPPLPPPAEARPPESSLMLLQEDMHEVKSAVTSPLAPSTPSMPGGVAMVLDDPPPRLPPLIAALAVPNTQAPAESDVRGSSADVRIVAMSNETTEILNALQAREADEDEAAEDVLSSVLLADHGTRVKSREELRRGLEEITERRKRYIKRLAAERGVAQPAYNKYTVAQWEQWLTEHSLPENDLQRCIKEWKDEFVECDLQKKEKVLALQSKNTRESKKEARNTIRGAFTSTLASKCEHSQLAYAFLKHPARMLDRLLSDWRDYMESKEYRDHKERSSRARDSDTATQQRKRKFKCLCLRQQWRQARKDDQSISDGMLTEDELSWSRRHLLQQFRSNELTSKLDAATREHGFGDLRLERKTLRAPSFA